MLESDRQGSANDRAVPKSFRHQRVKPEFGQCLAAARIVLGASGETKAAEAIGQGREQRALSQTLGPFLKILRQETVAAYGNNSGRRRGDADRARATVEIGRASCRERVLMPV